MKKTISFIISAAMTLGSLSVLSVSSEEELNTLVYNGLEYIEAGDSLLVLKGSADKAIKNVKIPSRVDGKNVTISTGAFSDCPDLVSIETEKDNVDYSTINGVLFEHDGLMIYPRGLKGEYTVPDGTSRIYDEAFSNAVGLTRVIIPDSLTAIGVGAFKNCKALTEFSGPVPLSFTGETLSGCSSLKHLELKENSGITSAMDISFYDFPELESLIIPDGFVLSGAFQLSKCPKLKEVVLPDRSTNLSVQIEDCEELGSLILPRLDSSHSWPNYSRISIRNCNSMKELSISNINNIAIENMPSLKELKLDLTIQAYSPDNNNIAIEYDTCPELKDIYFYNINVQPITEECEKMRSHDITVHCHKTDGWSRFLDYHKVDHVFIEDDEDAIEYGDVNADGKVDISDAVFIMQSISNPDKFTLTDAQRKKGDVAGNSDGITNLDALGIQKYLLKLEKQLPIR